MKENKGNEVEFWIGADSRSEVEEIAGFARGFQAYFTAVKVLSIYLVVRSR